MKIPAKILRECVFLTIEILLAIVFLIKGIIPPILEWNKLNNQENELKEKVQVLKQQINDRELLETLNESLLLELDELGEKLKNYHLKQIYVREISEAIKNHKLSLDQFKVMQNDQEISILIHVDGAFNQILSFCYLLETKPIPQKLQSLQLKLRRKKLQAHMLFLIPTRGAQND